jgi:probable DNA repair protein
LLSGHCAGDAQEAASHAAVDARWRRQARVRITATALQRDLTEAPRLAAAWAQAVDVWAAVGREAACDAWMPAMKTALLALGFPGERPLDSVGYQVMGALADLLGRYAALAPAAGQLDGVAAVRLLRRAAEATSFQPQRDPQARLDILGLLEAEGGHWDGVWILGMTDDILPASPKPNPLLPLVVLRQAGAPRATPERERAWAETLFAALRRSAAEIIVSHAHQDGERELRPSPLIAALPPSDWHTPTQAENTLLDVESVQDEQGPPLADGPGSAGGLDVLDTQARNPMWAFVRHRLGGRALAGYADAATVNVRGQFLHRALELSWRMMPDQERLHEVMATGRLPGLVAEVVAQAAADTLQAYPAALRDLECGRARDVLAGWFDLEARRTPFAVSQVEQEHAWRRGPLALKLRLDRMDMLPDGQAVIVDYKTGIAPASPESDWSRARPVNLQLPFYAAVMMEGDAATQVVGLMLAQIHARQVGVQGLADEGLGIDGITLAPDSKAFEGVPWADILARWRGAIESLADEYAAGHAVNAAYRMDDLKYCDAMPFLRLQLEDEDD